jgi:LmbE family N-acetylglucosaminyl deacetylase
MTANPWTDVPRLDGESTKRILCIGPHPDDNEIGAGGTIRGLAERGVEVTFLVVTDGSAGSADPDLQGERLVQLRRAEQAAACSRLGVSAPVIWLDYPDLGGLPPIELRERLILAIRRVKPDFILTVDPWLPYEAHPDHRQTGLAATEAFMLAGLPSVCPVQCTGGLTPHSVPAIAYYATAAPNQHINVDDTWHAKIASIAAHQSQFPGQILALLTGRLAAKARQAARYAAGQPCTYAESFKVMTIFQLHMNEDAAHF